LVILQKVKKQLKNDIAEMKYDPAVKVRRQDLMTSVWQESLEGIKFGEFGE